MKQIFMKQDLFLNQFKKSIMKTIHLLLALIPFVFSCSKSDDSQPANKDLIFENNTPVIIEDYINNVATTSISKINIVTTGIIKDYKKVTLEMNIQHDYQRDLEFVLIAPDGDSRTFIYRRGLSGKYLADQKLRFNANFTAQLPDDGQNFLAGNFKECKGSVSFNPPLVEPIFTFLQNKNIAGVWKLQVIDWEVVNSGSIKLWRLVFSEGALVQ
jgi:subtilisin-like proprotein convertase family protein